MTKQNSMLTGKPIKSIIKFSLPIMASSLLQYNYTLVDNILVGRYVSTDALAAVGGVASINSFIVGAALGLTSGFTIPVALTAQRTKTGSTDIPEAALRCRSCSACYLLLSRTLFPLLF